MPDTETKMKTITKDSTMTEIRYFIADQANKCADKWFPLQCRKEWAAFYLYWRTGELDVSDAETTPEGWTLASSERISPALTKAQVAAKINAIASTLPFLPV